MLSSYGLTIPYALKPFFWQQTIWKQWIQIYRTHRFPHGTSITGALGLGTDFLAHAFAGWLFCEKNAQQATACGICTYCCQFQVGSHPDFFMLGMDEHEIKVDKIRELISWLNQSRYYETPRVILIKNAHLMNDSCANGLLKTLEEPQEHTYFLMTAPHSRMLLSTIGSRLQHYRIIKPTKAETLSWLLTQCSEEKNEIALQLERVNGFPLDALYHLKNKKTQTLINLKEEILQLLVNSHYPEAQMQAWSAKGFDKLYLCEIWLMVIQECIVNTLLNKENVLIPKNLLLPNLWEFYDALKEWILSLQLGLNWNHRLNLEKLAQQWVGVFQKTKV